ncbi:MAG: thaumatin family protein [Deltaproteobacteria bacterium]|nr:thaumatin family protein [Deltaproteobacteria bacterium]
MSRTLLLLALVAACGNTSAAVDADPFAPDADPLAPDASSLDATPSVDAAPLPEQTARLRVVNRCAQPIWIAHSDNLAADQNVALVTDAFHDYDIPAGGLASVRLWPKTGCDATGHSCLIGDNGEGGGKPCGPNGCQPPFDSKFEATFADTASSAETWYDLSLVDGFTLPLAVRPLGNGTNTGTCVASDCANLTLDACPAQEQAGLDLRVTDPANAATTIACLAPCKAWNYPAPYGEGHPESQDPGLHLCCPTPIDPQSGNCTIANACMTPDACRAAGDPASVVHTSYVALVHARCPSAYSYSYDDEAGLHACPSATRFEVTFCP